MLKSTSDDEKKIRSKSVTIYKIDKYKHVFAKLPFQVNQAISECHKINLKEFTLKISDVIVLFNSHDCEFFQIQHIIFEKISNVFLVVKKFTNFYLDEHLQSYVLINNDFEWHVLKYNKIKYCYITHCNILQNGKLCFVKKWM